MDIRNIQRTGKMYYVYLPTAWCNKHSVDADTKVSLVHNDDGSLTVFPTVRKEKLKTLELTINEDDAAVLHKLIVACYINPTASFRIKLGKNLSFDKLLKQKNEVSLELVEVGTDEIRCEGSLTIEDVGALLKTMIRKVSNLILVMTKQYNLELMHRYEEEIDRSRMLIEKSVIDSFTFSRSKKLKTIDLYYISLLSKDVERFVDTLIRVDVSQKKFLISLFEIVGFLKDMVEDDRGFDGLEYGVVIEFIKKVELLEDVVVKDVKTYDRKRIKQILSSLSEILMDWAITKEVGV